MSDVSEKSAPVTASQAYSSLPHECIIRAIADQAEVPLPAQMVATAIREGTDPLQFAKAMLAFAKEHALEARAQQIANSDGDGASTALNLNDSMDAAVARVLEA